MFQNIPKHDNFLKHDLNKSETWIFLKNVLKHVLKHVLKDFDVLDFFKSCFKKSRKMWIF